MDLKVLSCGECEEEVDGVSLGDGCECLSEVDARFLCKTLCNKSGLVSRDLAGCRTFDTEDPLAADGLSVSRSGNQLECTNGHNCVHFSLHCCSPFVLVDRADCFLV